MPGDARRRPATPGNALGGRVIGAAKGRAISACGRAFIVPILTPLAKGIGCALRVTPLSTAATDDVSGRRPCPTAADPVAAALRPAAARQSPVAVAVPPWRALALWRIARAPGHSRDRMSWCAGATLAALVEV